MSNKTIPGLISIQTTEAPEELFQRVMEVLQSKGLSVFAVVDHSANAAHVGMTMGFSKLVIFGDAKAGTPLMQAAPTAAIDLPLKFLIWQDDDGSVWLSYNDPAYIASRHGLDEALSSKISGIHALAKVIAR